MAKHGKTGRKKPRRDEASAGGAAREGRAERSELKALRRLEAELTAALRVEGHRRRQLAAAEDATRSIAARIAEVAGGLEGSAAEAAKALLASVPVRAGDGAPAAPAPPAAEPARRRTPRQTATAAATQPARSARRPRTAVAPTAASRGTRRRTPDAAAASARASSPPPTPPEPAPSPGIDDASPLEARRSLRPADDAAPGD